MRCHHAQITVAGFTGVNEQGRGSCRSQRGGNFSPHMTALAHSHDDYPARRLQHLLHGLRKAHVQALAQAAQRGGFNVKGFPCQAQGLVGVKGARRGGRMHARILSTGA